MPAVPAGGPTPEAAGGRNLLLVRTGITFALLASAVSVHLRQPDLLLTGGFQYLYIAVVLNYGWLLLRYAVWGSRELPSVYPFVQAAVDVVFVSIIVFATGIYDSVFAFMYIVVIMLGCLEKFLWGALATAALSSAAYAAMLYLQSAGILVPPGSDGTMHLPFSQVLRPLVTNSVGFLLTGVLAGILGEEIRRARIRVRDSEDDLRTLEMFHKHVVDNIPSGILTTDTAGRINLINEAACLILGVREGDVRGKPVNRIFPDLTLPGLRPDARHPRPEIAFRRADGAEIFLGFSVSPLRNAEGFVIGRVIIFQDLTPVKQMEERIRIADRLAGVGELAAGLAHEIRNPLASIGGSSQMLRESPGLSGDARTLLDIIERESTRLNSLITDFLLYTGVSVRSSGAVPMADLVREVMEAVRAGEARERGIEVGKRPLQEVVAEGDPERLRQVLWNLVRNAIQATPQGGRIDIDLFPQVRHGERYAVITVSDTGRGIDPGILGKIYNPFFTTKEGGTGLGLSISQRIVHSHRGFMEVRSTPGGGTTFSVFLPERAEGMEVGANA